MIFQTTTRANIGEIAQGAISPGKPFLVSNLLSSKFSTTTYVTLQETSQTELEEKSHRAYRLFLDRYKTSRRAAYEAAGIKIWQESNIPKGKGLSSSSADVVGVLSALNTFFNHPFAEGELYKMAAEVDPTDAVLSPALTVFNQTKGEVVTMLQSIPYSLIFFDSDPDSAVDTVQFTRNKIYTHQDYRFYNQLLENLIAAADKGDITGYLFWTTQSAVYNQKFLTKKHLNKLVSFALSKDLGVFAAHSGTVMGLVIPYPPDDMLVQEAEGFVRSVWGTEIYVENQTNQPDYA
jgi:L-threonine kinase